MYTWGYACNYKESLSDNQGTILVLLGPSLARISQKQIFLGAFALNEKLAPISDQWQFQFQALSEYPKRWLPFSCYLNVRIQ